MDSRSRGEGLFRGCLLYAIAAVSLLVWASLFPTVFHRLTCAFQVQQEEAANLEFGRILVVGEPLYRDIRQEGPYLHPYPPLYPTILSLCLRVIPGLWLPGRLPAFLGYLACGLLMAGWGWKRWGPPVTLAILGMFLISPTWLSWGTMARMDSLLVLVNFSAFLLLYSIEPAQSMKSRREKGAGSMGDSGPPQLAGPHDEIQRLYFHAGGLGLRSLAPEMETRGPGFFGSCSGSLRLEQSLLAMEQPWELPAVSQMAGRQPLFIQPLVFFNDLFRQGMRLAGGRGRPPALWKKSLSLLLVFQLAFSTLWFLTASCQPTSAENHYMEFLLFGFSPWGKVWR